VKRVRGFEVANDIPETERAARRLGDRGFGKMVEQLRRDHGKSRIVFSALAHCDAAALAAIEDGRQRATVEWPRIVAAVTGADYLQVWDVWSRGAPNGEVRMSVEEARAQIQRLLGEGVDCPCCGRLCKEARRSVSKPMVRFARWLVRSYSGAPVDARAFVKQTNQHGGDYAKIVYWGLGRREPGGDPMWSPTTLGYKWVRGEAKVQRVAVVWRNDVLRHEGKLVTPDDIEPETRPERTGVRQSLPGISCNAGEVSDV